jgi:hypothetical protein
MIFIRFLDDVQVEAIQRNTSPGEEWLEAPSNFDWNKMHKLVNGEVVEMTEEDAEPTTNVVQEATPESVVQEQLTEEPTGEIHA